MLCEPLAQDGLQSHGRSRPRRRETPASSSNSVSEPVPAPTSSTVSAGFRSAAATSFCIRFRSIRKFCPNLCCGARPAPSSSCLICDFVCPGMTPIVTQTGPAEQVATRTPSAPCHSWCVLTAETLRARRTQRMTQEVVISLRPLRLCSCSAIRARKPLSSGGRRAGHERLDRRRSHVLTAVLRTILLLLLSLRYRNHRAWPGSHRSSWHTRNTLSAESPGPDRSGHPDGVPESAFRAPCSGRQGPDRPARHPLAGAFASASYRCRTSRSMVPPSVPRSSPLSPPASTVSSTAATCSSIPPGTSTARATRTCAANSGAHEILQQVPDVRVVLVRTRGLWGSGFSLAGGEFRQLGRFLLGQIADFLQSGLLFVPRRTVTVELYEPPDLPAQRRSQRAERVPRTLLQRRRAAECARGLHLE